MSADPRTPHLPRLDARAVVADLLRSGSPPDRSGPLDVDGIVAVAHDEGVLPLLAWTLGQGGDREPAGGGDLAPLREALAPGAQEAARQELHREGELRRLDRALQAAGIRTLLLKGSALGRWLYPSPYLRVSADIDILVESRDVATRVLDVTAPLGYVLAYAPSPTSHEMTARLLVDGHSRSELDIHCRLLNAAAYADLLPFEELWAEAQAMAPPGTAMRVLSPRHALAHACLNRALDMQNGEPDRLKLLYDLHLLAHRFDNPQWNGVVELCAARRISGICLRSLNDAVAVFASPVPSSVAAALAAQAEGEPIDWRRLHDWRYMQWRHLRALPGLRARLAWLWQRLLPGRGQLEALHGQGSWATLVARRLQRLWRRFAS